MSFASERLDLNSLRALVANDAFIGPAADLADVSRLFGLACGFLLNAHVRLLPTDAACKYGYRL